MLRYRVGGVELRSDLPLSLLPAAPEGSDLGARLALAISGEALGEPARWLYHDHFEDMSEPWRGVGAMARPGAYLVRLYRLADFLLEGERACVHMQEGTSEGTVETLFLEQVLPLWWSLLGRPCLHASAVALRRGGEWRGVAFAGRSGSGKSSLATSFAAGARGALLSDDCLAIEVEGGEVIAQAGARAVRLRDDSARAFFESAAIGERSIDGGKRRIEVMAAGAGERAPSGGVPLARVYMLEPGGEVARVVRLRGRDAVARLAGCFFRIDPGDVGRLPDELAMLEAIAARTVVATLEVPRRFEALAEVRAVIDEDLANG